jgi:hypothetical protein
LTEIFLGHATFEAEEMDTLTDCHRENLLYVMYALSIADMFRIVKRNINEFV